MQGLEYCCISSLLDTINDLKRRFSISPTQRWFWWSRKLTKDAFFILLGLVKLLSSLTAHHRAGVTSSASELFSYVDCLQIRVDKNHDLKILIIF